MGSELAMMEIAPLIRPEAPILAMARAIMSMAEVWAAPQSADPISKTAKKEMNDHCAC